MILTKELKTNQIFFLTSNTKGEVKSLYVLPFVS